MQERSKGRNVWLEKRGRKVNILDFAGEGQKSIKIFSCKLRTVQVGRALFIQSPGATQEKASTTAVQGLPKSYYNTCQ